MPYRPVAFTADAFTDFVRETQEELGRLKRGEYLRGRVGFDSIQIGNCLITVEGGGGTPHGIVVKFRNVATEKTVVMAVLP